MASPQRPHQPLDTAYMALIEAQADRAMPTQLRVWVEKLRAQIGSEPGGPASGSAHDYASALMLKLEHLFAAKSVRGIEVTRPFSDRR